MKWNDFADKINELSLRERIIVLGALLLVIFGIWYYLWFYSVEKSRQQQNDEIQALESKMEQFNREISAFQSLANSASTDGKRQELSRAIADLREFDKELAAQSHGLVAPHQLAKALTDLLSEIDAVALVELKSEPAEPIPVSGGDPSDEITGIYRHTLQLTLSGEFFEILQFVERVESMKWRFHWESLEYEVQAYPKGQVTIRIFTLSAEEGPLGV